MIHVLNFRSEIIDFISQDDSAIISATHSRNINDRTETFDFTILSDRAENLQDRNRIIIQDSNKQYREFIITHVSQDIDGYTEVETDASYLEDISYSVPYAKGSLKDMTPSQALKDVLKDTGWSVSQETEYAPVATTTWDEFQTRYEVLNLLCTTYDMIPNFYIEIDGSKVTGRYVSLKFRNPLFNGKEIVYGKDLLEMTRTVDMSEINTGLLVTGPQRGDNPGYVVTVVDDEANNRYSMPGRYLWGVFAPNDVDENVTKDELTKLGKEELDKRKVAAISYEVKSTDISRAYPHEVIHLGDQIRVKNEDFIPPLYLEAEVIGEEYDLISEDSEYTFGQYKEYTESELKKAFEKRLADIQQKMNDSINNINTIVQQTQEGNLEYFEKKIIKSSTPPPNPVNDMLWYDTSNPDVAVIRRYWNGEWIESTAENVEQLGGVTREKALFSELNNTFINLTIQHSRLLNDVYEIVNSEYLVDDELRDNVNSKLNDTVNVFNQIKSNLESMTPETATIGKLVDTQQLFLTYRQKMQALYTVVETAKIAIDKRFRLLQSQYTEEKFNEAMNKVAEGINGTWDEKTGQLVANIPNREELEKAMQSYTDGKLDEFDDYFSEKTDSKIKQAKDELSSNISSVDNRIDGISVGGRNLIKKSDEIFVPNNSVTPIRPNDFWIVDGADEHILSFQIYVDSASVDAPQTIEFSYRLQDAESDSIVRKQSLDIKPFIIPGGTTIRRANIVIDTKGYYLMNDLSIDTTKTLVNTLQLSQLQLESGNVPTSYRIAPEDTDENIAKSKQDAIDAAKAYAKAQDDLKQVEAKAYADGKVTAEEQRAINDAKAKLTEAKAYVDSVQIGGRNLLENSLSFNKGMNDNSNTSYNQLWYVNLNSIKNKVSVGDTVTISFDLQMQLGNNFQVYDTVRHDTMSIGAITTKNVGKEKFRYVYTTVIKSITSNSTDWYMYLYNNNDVNDKFSVSNIKIEKGNKPTDWTPAPEDTDNKINQITTTQVQQSTDIKQLKDSITLKADKTEVKTIFDQNIKPLQTQVNDQKAQLDVLPSQINSKVSQSTYTTDQNNIISRLNSADTQRQQLSNEISDRVTISQFNNLKVGGRNLLLESKGPITNSNYFMKSFPITEQLKPDDTVTLSVKGDFGSDRTSFLVFNTTGLVQIGSLISSDKNSDGVFVKTFKWVDTRADGSNKVDSSSLRIYQYPNGATSSSNIEWIKLERGSVPTDYSVAPEDTDKTLTNMQSQITQNGESINARVTKDAYNATNKTLSKAIADFTINTTTGLTLKYDDNGTIQSSTVGPNGVMIKGDRVDITVNKDFKVMTTAIDDKVGKSEIVNRLNLSNEGLDINVNNLGIRGGDKTNYLTIKNQEILSQGVFTRTWSGVTDTPTATVGISNGYIMSRNQKTGYSLYMTEKGLSTMMSGGVGSEQAGALEFHYDLMNDNSRGVRLSSTYGVVFLHAENSRIYTRSRLTTNIETWEASVYIRPYVAGRVGVNEFAFYVKDNASAQYTDGTILFGELSPQANQPGYGNAGSGIRFRKAGMPTETSGDYEPMIYATNNQGDIGTGSFYGNNLYGDLKAKSVNAYAMTDSTGEFRVTDFKGYNGGSPNYTAIRAREIKTTHSYAFSNHSGADTYMGVATKSLRITDNNWWNGGSPNYKPVYASAFTNGSRVEFKEAIQKWDYDALTVLNETDIYSYRYKNDEEGLMHRGLIIGDGYKTPPEFIQGDGINLYEMITWSLRAIQQLSDITERQNEKINELEEKLDGTK